MALLKKSPIKNTPHRPNISTLEKTDAFSFSIISEEMSQVMQTLPNDKGTTIHLPYYEEPRVLHNVQTQRI